MMLHLERRVSSGIHPFDRLSRSAKTFWMTLAALFCLGPLNGALGNQPEDWRTYGLLLDYIRMEDRNDPLVEFVLTGEGVDKTLSRENRAFISRNTPLLEKIKSALHSEELNWQLRQATQRLMVVPEKHPEYAALFESYCRAVIDYVLEKTRLPNPYDAIATLEASPGEALAPGEKGITAYLVHNIADVYTEEYVFFDDRNQDRKVSVKLDNRVYRGEIGSYSSYLLIEGERHFTFERNTYTLWRNSAEDPLNVFIAPVEETLHIALRDATQKAIRMRLAEQPPGVLSDIETVVDDWLAIEEAVVGGLVNELMPEILAYFLEADAAAKIAQSFADRHRFDRYRFIDQGIEVVGRLGLAAAIRTYQEKPFEFEALLSRPAAEIAEPAAPAGRETEGEPAV